jgi:hypothetical protein
MKKHEGALEGFRQYLRYERFSVIVTQSDKIKKYSFYSFNTP